MKTLIIYTLIVGAITIGCKKTDFTGEKMAENLDSEIVLTISDGQMQESNSKAYGLSTAQERQIKTLDVLIFNSAGSLVSRTHLDNPVSLTNTIGTKSGSNMSVYAIANANIALNASSTPNDALGMVRSVADLKNIKITNLFNDIQTNKTLMMVGVFENVTVQPSPASNSPLTIQLDYVVAKVTVNFINSLPPGDQFNLADWKLGDIARYSYIIPRPTEDAVTPAVASDFVTQSSTNSWDDATITINGTATPVKTTTFYLFENRRGATSNTDPAKKSGSTAPAKSTRIIATGYYKSGNTTTGVDINLMLGENSYSDYNIKRTYQYTYNVTVRGIANIDTDTRYTRNIMGCQVDVMKPTLDAHYDFRPLRIMAYSGSSTITILNTDGTPPASNFWLKLSKLNITKFTDTGGGVYQRPSYSPSNDMTLSTVVNTNPSSGIETQFVYLYADEFLIESGTRTALVRVQFQPQDGTAPFTTDLTITQRGIQLAGNVGLRTINPSTNKITSNQYKLGYDLINEEALSITPGNQANERTMQMQFGSFNNTQIIALDNNGRRNGYENTIRLVFINSNTLRDPYGRSGNSPISYADWDPIYNTSAARYCFEKNRDLNGDGQIMGSEIKWYLPSIEEQSLIAVGNMAWSSSPGDLWPPTIGAYSSTQYSSTYTMSSYFPYGQSTPANSSTTQLAVRCVRRM